MNNKKPRVSIGLPVYNGERFIEEAIESLLAQTFEDFELIISDNASTDRTEAICRSFASRDKRIRYCRNSHNLGAAANFNRTVELASGEYFKWAADDDLCAPDLLSKCIRILDENPSVVVCQSEVKVIDENGKFLSTYDSKLHNIDSHEAHLRFADLIGSSHWCFDVFGLIRINALKQTPLIAAYTSSDRNTLVALGLLGRFYRIPEYLFSSRDHRERSIRKIPWPASRAEWFDPKKRGKIEYAYWRIFLEYIKCLHRVKLPVRQRVACYMHLVRWLKANDWRLKRDVKVGIKQAASNFVRTLQKQVN